MRGTGTLDQPDRRDGVRRTVEPVDEHDDVVEDAEWCDPRPPRRSSDDSVKELIV